MKEKYEPFVVSWFTCVARPVQQKNSRTGTGATFRSKQLDQLTCLARNIGEMTTIRLCYSLFVKIYGGKSKEKSLIPGWNTLAKFWMLLTKTFSHFRTGRFRGNMISEYLYIVITIFTFQIFHNLYSPFPVGEFQPRRKYILIPGMFRNSYSPFPVGEFQQRKKYILIPGMGFTCSKWYIQIKPAIGKMEE